MGKKKVLVLGVSPYRGGVESYIMNWFRNIDKQKFEFYFMFRNQIAYKEEIITLGGNLLQLQVSRHNPIKYTKYIKNIFKHYNFDVVYYNTCDMFSMDMIIFGRRYNVPVRIIHSHNSSNIIRPNLLHRVTEKCCKRNLNIYATKLLACSKVAGQWMFENRNFEIVKNGIDIDKFQFSTQIRNSIRKKLGIEKKFVIGFVGSLWEQKNPFFLLKIFVHLYKRNRNAELLIVGDGKLKSQMKEEVNKLGLEGAVKFLGVQENIPAFLSAMDSFLLPSLFEGLPFVLIEAQTNGLPCITSTNVSKESNVTGEVLYLDLNAAPDIWAEKIQAHKVKYERTYYAEIMRNQGYDIYNVVKQIEQYFNGK